MDALSTDGESRMTEEESKITDKEKVITYGKCKITV
jgi:hypothetical protein